MDTLEYPSELQLQQTNLTVTEQDMIALFQRFMVLQDQFKQLTNHVEKIYTELARLDRVISNEVLS